MCLSELHPFGNHGVIFKLSCLSGQHAASCDSCKPSSTSAILRIQGYLPAGRRARSCSSVNRSRDRCEVWPANAFALAGCIYSDVRIEIRIVQEAVHLSAQTERRQRRSSGVGPAARPSGSQKSRRQEERAYSSVQGNPLPKHSYLAFALASSGRVQT